VICAKLYAVTKGLTWTTSGMAGSERMRNAQQPRKQHATEAARELAATRKTVMSTCVECGAGIEGTTRKIYCSKRCSKRASRKHLQEQKTQTAVDHETASVLAASLDNNSVGRRLGGDLYKTDPIVLFEYLNDTVRLILHHYITHENIMRLIRKRHYRLSGTWVWAEILYPLEVLRLSLYFIRDSKRIRARALYMVTGDYAVDLIMKTGILDRQALNSMGIVDHQGRFIDHQDARNLSKRVTIERFELMEQGVPSAG
jgi:hypothetical protein